MQQTSSPGIRVEHISQKFGKKVILKDVSFEAKSGDCIGILGINGSGKSTLLSILAGIHRPKGGSFICFGTDMFRESDAFRKMIGYLPQENPLLMDLTVYDNLRLWYGRKITPDLPVLHQMQLTEMLPEKVSNLSGGMRRRLAVACAVAADQKVLVLDEPTSSLDLHQQMIIRDYIKAYAGRGGIVILSTHDIPEIELCSSLYYLENGVADRTDLSAAVRRLQEGHQ